MEGVRVAYTLEQCWHRVPGGTAVSAIEVARAMPMVRADVDLLGVAGRHGEDSAVTFDISIDVAGLPISGPLLYETSLRLRQPRVERVLSDIDVLHNTSIIPFATSGKMVSTVHDLAFLHHPDFFTRHGNAVFARSLKVLKKRADMLLCSSTATVNDCLELVSLLTGCDLFPWVYELSVQVQSTLHKFAQRSTCQVNSFCSLARLSLERIWRSWLKH
jgi:hypothetical protein